MPPRRAEAKMTSMLLRPPENDRVLDWRDEWRRLEPRVGELPAAARVAVLQLVRRFHAEDAASRSRAA